MNIQTLNFEHCSAHHYFLWFVKPTIVCLTLIISNLFLQQYPYHGYYSPYVYQVPASQVELQVGPSLVKDRLNIILQDVEGFIDTLGNRQVSVNFKALLPKVKSLVEYTVTQCQTAPGPDISLLSSDAEFAAYREKQNQIFKTVGDVVRSSEVLHATLTNM